MLFSQNLYNQQLAPVSLSISILLPLPATQSSYQPCGWVDNRLPGERPSRGMDNPMDRGGRAKRQPAHCPDHRDCPHPRAFAHAPHRAKGVTGSPYRVFMVTVTVNQEAGQRLRRGPRLRGSVSNGGLPTPLLHNTKSIHTRRARVGDKTILKQRLTLAAVRVE